MANSQSTQYGSLSWDGKDIALTYDKGGIYLGENNNSNNRISINDTGNITLRAAKGIYIRPALNDTIYIYGKGGSGNDTEYHEGWTGSIFVQGLTSSGFPQKTRIYFVSGICLGHKTT